MSEIRTRPLMKMTIAVAKPVVVGETPAGLRVNVEVTGGTFEGDRLKGEILGGGNDWIIRRPDGTAQLDVRLVLRTDDGAVINMTYKGFRHGPAEVLKRLDRGETVDPSEYYFPTHVRLSTSAPRLAWLNDLLAVSTGERRRDSVRIDVHEVV